jgi:predicted RecA/RadA family phage recombinase
MNVIVKLHGQIIPYTPSADLAAGTLIHIGDLPAVTLEPMKAGVQGGVAVCAIIDGPRQTGAAWTQGTVVYWDTANTRFTTTSTGNKRVGVVVGSDVSSSATRALVSMDR